MLLVDSSNRCVGRKDDCGPGVACSGVGAGARPLL